MWCIRLPPQPALKSTSSSRLSSHDQRVQIKATKMTPKGMIGVIFQIYTPDDEVDDGEVGHAPPPKTHGQARLPLLLGGRSSLLQPVLGRVSGVVIMYHGRSAPGPVNGVSWMTFA